MTAPVMIAILVYPETTAAVAFGMHDLFLSAGRDWSVLTEGTPGPELIRPLPTARRTVPFEVANGVRVFRHLALADCRQASVICVPEVALPPEAPLAERFSDEIGWLRQRYDEGVTIVAGCATSCVRVLRM